MPAADFAKLDAANKDDAKAHEFWASRRATSPS
jgi:hypothetical protein